MPRRYRLTVKVTGGHRLLRTDVELEGPVTQEQLTEAAQSVAERLGKRAATRPASKTRASKKTAARDSDGGES